MTKREGDPPTPRRGPQHRRLSVDLDLPGVLALLLVGVFVLILATVGYGFLTQTLKPELALAAGSTLFSGLLAGALAARRNGSQPPPQDAPKGDTDQRGEGGP